MNARNVFLVVLILSCSQVAAQTSANPLCNITVEIANLQSDKGKVMVALYNSKETYMESRYKEVLAHISNDLKASAVLADVPTGTYAISIFHDENDNDELDLKFMKIPKEPYGFSNNVRGTLGPASFEEASFKLESDTTLIIEVN